MTDSKVYRLELLPREIPPAGRNDRQRIIMKLLFLLLLLPLLTCAQVPPTLPLDSVLSAVLRQNPQLRQYDAQIKAADAYVAGARGWEAPQVAAGPFMRPYSPGQGMDEAAPMSKGSIMVTTTQMVPNPARQRAQTQYLQSRGAVDVANRATALNQLRADVKLNYYNWLMISNKLHVLEATESLMEFVIRSIELRYKYGGSKLSDAYRAKAALLQHHAEEMELEGQWKEARANLNTLMNRDPQTPFEIDTTYHLRLLDRSLDTAELATTRHDVQALDQQLVRNSRQLALERTARLPEFGVQYSHMNTLAAGSPNQYSLMGMVSLPFVPWAARQYKANLAGLGLEAQALRAQRAALVSQAAGRVEAINARRRAKFAQVQMYQEEIVPMLLKSYRATLLAYEQNTEDLTAVLQAWESLRTGRLETVNQEQELLRLQVEFEREQEQ